MKKFIFSLLLLGLGISMFMLGSPVAAQQNGIINFNDGGVDPLWDSIVPFYESTSPQNPITKAYFLIDGVSPEWFYFRIDTNITLEDSYMYIGLDCNDDGIAADLDDPYIDVFFEDDALDVIFYGPNLYVSEDYQVYAEYIETDPDQFQIEIGIDILAWADAREDDPDIEGLLGVCLASRVDDNGQLAAKNIGVEVIFDEGGTPLAEFPIVTSIALSQIDAQPAISGSFGPIILIAGILILLTFGVLVWRRPQASI